MEILIIGVVNKCVVIMVDIFLLLCGIAFFVGFILGIFVTKKFL